jgi:FlaA1/EpsC-like NDP-sugar epimerase
MIRLSGRSVEDIVIVFSGLRPGEKLYEELLSDKDTTLPTSVPRLRIAQLDDRAADAETLEWLAAVQARGLEVDDADVRVLLRERVPEYRAAAPAKTTR